MDIPRKYAEGLEGRPRRIYVELDLPERVPSKSFFLYCNVCGTQFAISPCHMRADRDHVTGEGRFCSEDCRSAFRKGRELYRPRKINHNGDNEGGGS